MIADALLDIRDLSARIGSGPTAVQALSDVDLIVRRGEVVGLVGESGGGKSMIARSIVAMLPRRAVATGQVLVDGNDVLTMGEPALQAHRGSGAALCSQNPRSSLSPMRTVGQQLIDRLQVHRHLDAGAAADVALELVRTVGIRDPRARLRAYPHELSGGMCQRVMIALALACEPKLLLADEPTTGLDVTLSEDILQLFRRDADLHGRGVLIISHDLASIAQICDRLVVLYAGTVVEAGLAHTVLRQPAHHYTDALLRSVPDIDGAPVVPTSGSMPLLHEVPDACPFAVRCDHADDVCVAERPPLQQTGNARLAACVHPLTLHTPIVNTVPKRTDRRMPPRLDPDVEVVVDVRKADVIYRSRFGRGGHQALFGVDLQVCAGETVGIVGESGCGKSTLARLIMGLIAPTSGSAHLVGSDLSGLSGRELRRLRTRAQMVFQDPIGALSPRRTVRQAIAEPMAAAGVATDAQQSRVDAALTGVGLDLQMAGRLPHQLSGGQAQRVGIARALAVDPQLVVFDEPTSALDVTVQAQILDLAAELASDGQRSYIFISHDLATVANVCDRVVVLYLGRVVEEGTTADVFSDPRHPYTRALLASAPSLRSEAAADRLQLDPDLGEDGVNIGCPLRPRCPLATEECHVDPPLDRHPSGRAVACWNSDPAPRLMPDDRVTPQNRKA